MKTKIPTQKRIRCESLQPFQLRAVETENLPEGVCGRIVGIGLRYNQPDWYGTMFMPGCLAKSVASKVGAGKVKFYADHRYTTEHHIGVVRKVEDVGEDVLVSADIFDTARGKAYLEYAKACVATKAQTGLSIGFYDRDSEWKDMPDGVRVLAFTEVELEEFSGTPANAVEGADLLAARAGGQDPARQQLLRRALEHLLDVIPEPEWRALIEQRQQAVVPSTPSTTSSNAALETDSATPSADTRNAGPADSPAPAAPADPTLATMDDRVLAVRQSLSR